MKITTPKGMILYVHINCNRNKEVAAVVAVSDKEEEICHNIKVNIKQAHGMFGHMDKEQTRKIAKHLGTEITCKMLKICKDGAGAKAKQKKVTKVSEHEISKEPNGRTFLDIWSIKKPKNSTDIKKVAKLYWRIMVDQRTHSQISLRLKAECSNPHVPS